MKYNNPIICGFNPDPSICRVGGDYYLVTSTFEYFPGIPIYHSRDLLNWEIIGHCITRTEQIPLEKVRASQGIWAPTIRYNNGRFYVTATFNERSNFIVYADDPRGEWSDPIWAEMDGIDPSMFFENGKMYYCANDFGSRGGRDEGISLAEMNPETGAVIGEIKRIWRGAGGGWLEAPHIYHIGDWYYLLAAEGGSGQGHMTVAARSKELFGGYESCPDNPILTNRHDTSKLLSYCGHSDLFEDSKGKWWIVHLGIRCVGCAKSHIGRETFLTPIEWKNEWPVVENDRKAALTVDADIDAEQRIAGEWSADFSKPVWENEWLFLRKPSFENYERKNNKLYLYPAAVSLTDTASPTFAAVRHTEICCEINTHMEFDTYSDGDEAGLVLYLEPKCNYRICKRREGGKDYIIVEKLAGDFRMTTYKKESRGGGLHFRIAADKDMYNFYYSENGEDDKFACQASTKFLLCETVGRCFTGTVIGLYSQCKAATQACAEIESFHIAKSR